MGILKSGYIKRRLGFKTRKYGGAKKTLKSGKIATRAYVKRIISAEKETHNIQTDATLTTTLTSAANYSTLLNPLSQGDTDNTRTGDKVKFTSFKGKLQIIGAAGLNQNYRCTIVRQKNPRGNAASIADVFGAGANVFHHFNHSNVDFTSRYEIVLDKTMNIASNHSTQVGYGIMDISFDADQVADYSLGNAGSIADIDTNAYILMLQTDAGTAATVNVSSLFFYKDQ